MLTPSSTSRCGCARVETGPVGALVVWVSSSSGKRSLTLAMLSRGGHRARAESAREERVEGTARDAAHIGAPESGHSGLQPIEPRRERPGDTPSCADCRIAKTWTG